MHTASLRKLVNEDLDSGLHVFIVAQPHTSKKGIAIMNRPKLNFQPVLIKNSFTPETRRGVLLIIVLLILTLFMLLGTTYVIVATRAKKTADSFSESTLSRSPAVQVARNVTDYASLALLRGGTAPPLSASEEEVVQKFLDNSLLADKYGDYNTNLKLERADNISGCNPFFQLTLKESLGTEIYPSDYTGRIATIEDSEEAGNCFRIVAVYDFDNSDPTIKPKMIVVQANPSETFTPSTVKSGWNLVINGREFAGEDGSPNENYDAPDEQNLAMAWLQPEALVGPNNETDSDDPSDGHKYIIPSFHRPDTLLAFVKTSLLQNPEASISFGKRMLRPKGKMGFLRKNWMDPNKSGVSKFPFNVEVDHPNFTGSNVTTDSDGIHYFDPINGPWDIDNDNDGVKDSVWIDIGYSNCTIDSVTYKPLVAMLILDMDGRLNVNAHGSLKEIYFDTSHRALNPNPDPAQDTGIYFAGTDPNAPVADIVTPRFASLPAGSGVGVADVDLSLILDQSTLTSPLPLILTDPQRDPWRKYALKNILIGANSGPLDPSNSSNTTGPGIQLPNLKAEGRYGDSTNLSNSLEPAPGKKGRNDPPRGATSTALAIDSKTPDNFVSEIDADTYDYGSPIDPWGRMQIGTDSLGQPFYTRLKNLDRTYSSNMPYKWDSDAIDDPYDISLGRNAARPGWLYDPNVNTSPSTTDDNLYGTTDLERLLRLRDADTKRLSGRILSATGPASEFARLTMTTDSWDTPAIPFNLSLWKDLLHLDPSLVSWDIQLGLRMNINRPFGDGQDNSDPGDPGYGIVDEPGEFSLERDMGSYGLSTFSQYKDQCLTNGRDVDGNSIVNEADQNLARQLFARHLYVMARVLIDNNNLSAKDAAQWAVNVVDFRDSDSIITGFKYDENFIKTSTTWNPNKTVWGCERPELLITEALAWNNYKEKEESTIPKTYSYSDLSTGGFVVEFYSPWTTQTDALTRGSPLPSEFRHASNHKNPAGISMSAELDLLTKHRNASAFQLVAVEETTGVTSTKLSNDPTWPQRNADIKQIIYFQKGSVLDDSLPVNQSGSAFYMPENTRDELQTLKPGQFAILGGNTIMPVGKNTGPAMTIKSINLDSNSFDDTEPKQPVTVNILTETFDNGSQSNRMTFKEFPRHPTAGPVGAMIVTDANFTLPVDRGPPPTPGTEGNPTPKPFRLLFRRLANPLLDYESITNPYITVDSIVVQQLLTISDATRSSETLSFNSAQRGKTLDGVPSTDPNINNIWRQSDADVNSPGNPYSELGPYCGTVPTTVKWSLGFFSKGLKMPAKGSTSQTFPWLTWQNRPYTSTSELLLVPKSNSFTLLREHSGKAPYAHLFFDLETPDPKIGLLEFLRVPDRYADTDTWIDPAVADTLSKLSGTPMYLPPHNYMSEFREPGKINANTIANDLVWDAINSGHPSASYMDEGTDGDFVPSEDWPINATNTSGNGNWYRDANEDTNGNTRLDLNDDRNNNNKQELGRKTLSGSRRGWEITNGSSSLGNFDYILNRLGVTQGALWFSKPFQSSLEDTEKSLLYRSNGSNASNRDLLFSSKVHISDTVKARPYADSERNPYHRYRGINRLSNLLTTRSNVYAVWMTVGFFEIDSNQKLGPELGIENGEPQRSKSFMIIDRSLPLGYKKGINLNVQDAIIHQRQNIPSY